MSGPCYLNAKWSALKSQFAKEFKHDNRDLQLHFNGQVIRPLNSKIDSLTELVEGSVIHVMSTQYEKDQLLALNIPNFEAFKEASIVGSIVLFPRFSTCCPFHHL